MIGFLAGLGLAVILGWLAFVVLGWVVAAGPHRG